MAETLAIIEELISVTDGPAVLSGTLAIPAQARGIVLFAHGSGSSRHSPRNIFVARRLNGRGLATLLIDLLTEAEDVHYSSRFDIGHLAQRLIKATEWVRKDRRTGALKLGYFGASTGAAAALMAAAALPDAAAAVVSRGGRPDLAGAGLRMVKAPTLLIVGGADNGVVDLNQQAYEQLTCPRELVVVPGASHLFEEPGTLEEVARLAEEWFRRHLT